jgi:tetratricopeptide (TPR) repeat protein
MPDNSTDNITELLVKYMDNELLPDEKPAVEKMLHENAEVKERYQYLLAAKQAIRHENLKQRVQRVHDEYISTGTTNKTVSAKVIKPSAFKIFMRIAAVFIAVIAGYGIFQYASTTNQSVYNNNFINYELPVNRGVNNTSSIDSLYTAANYNAVIKTFEEKPQKNQQDYFIAAQSYLHLDNTQKAIQSFLEVKKLNDASAQKYFVDETDYYLALAYIKTGNVDDAENLLNKITADKQNLFYNKAKELSGYKLTILKMKQ